jgi:hypothetical protein
MKRMLTVIAMLGLTSFGLNLAAQQTASPQSQQPDATQQQPVDSQSSAQSFEGKITKSGDKLVLQDASSQATYQLDDQDKAKQFKGPQYQPPPCGRYRSFGEQIACDTSNQNQKPAAAIRSGLLIVYRKRFRINRLGFKDRCC